MIKTRKPRNIKHDPNTIRDYRRRKPAQPVLNLECGRPRMNLRLPMYLYREIVKEAADTGRSINTVTVQMLEAGLNPD